MCCFSLPRYATLAIIITLLLAQYVLINAGLIIYTGVNPLVITPGTMWYLFGGSALLLFGMAGATGYEGIGGFPTAFDFANISFLLVFPCRYFFLCAVCFSGCSCIVRIWDATFF